MNIKTHFHVEVSMGLTRFRLMSEKQEMQVAFGEEALKSPEKINANTAKNDFALAA